MLDFFASFENSDWVAAAALIVSAVALGVSIFELMSNKPKLRVRANLALEVGPDGDLHYYHLAGFSEEARAKFLVHKRARFVTVSVANFGTQPTTVRTLHFKVPHVAGILLTQPIKSLGANFMTLLGPGETITFYFDADQRLAPSEELLFEALFKSKAWVNVDHSWSTRSKRKALR